MTLIPHIPVEQWAIKPTLPDARDYQYSLMVADPLKSTARPKALNRTKLVQRNQKDIPMCGGMALANAKDMRESVVCSGAWAYKKAKEVDGDPTGEGTTIRALMDVATKVGVCKDELFKTSFFVDSKTYPPITEQAIADASRRKAEGYVAIRNREEMLDAIWKYGSVTCGIMVTDSFVNLNDGYVPRPEGKVLGGHAIDFISYDENMTHTYPNGETHTGFVMSPNWWSGDWGGLNGDFWYPLDILFTDPMKTYPFTYMWDSFAVIDEFPIVSTNFTMDTAPFIKDSRTFVPIRFIAEALGANVMWDDNAKTIQIVSPGVTINMAIGDKNYTVLKGAL